MPPEAEIQQLLEKALQVIEPEKLWVNPDCGLKTRGWPEVEAALSSMVKVSKTLRRRLAQEADATV